MTDRLLRIRDVAEMTGFSEDTLRSWRKRGVGPRSSRLAGAVVFRESDVLAWIEAAFKADGSPAA